jgi:hypothetical protein
MAKKASKPIDLRTMTAAHRRGYVKQAAGRDTVEVVQEWHYGLHHLPDEMGRPACGQVSARVKVVRGMGAVTCPACAALLRQPKVVETDDTAEG